MRREQSLFGYVLIIFGAFIFFFGVWNLIFKLALGFLGLFLINYGLILNGLPSLFSIISRIINLFLRRH